HCYHLGAMRLEGIQKLVVVIDSMLISVWIAIKKDIKLSEQMDRLKTQQYGFSISLISNSISS
ncbi:MAG TPA: hypothetical protein V6C95_00605, partial [Coleofasciculaceae cyanobacterium]